MLGKSETERAASEIAVFSLPLSVGGHHLRTRPVVLAMVMVRVLRGRELPLALSVVVDRQTLSEPRNS